jgi:pimeloyl-ACP methyl ester carboxylesterase
MTQEYTHIRTAGRGPTVLCLHSSASSGNQWQALSERLSDRHKVIMPDLIGYGRSPGWSKPDHMTLADEVRALTPFLSEADQRIDVVGHSFGAAVALELALTFPDRINSLTLYEPVPFQLLQGQPATGDSWAEILNLSMEIWHDVLDGRDSEAAARFVRYWGGPSAWSAMSESQQERVTGYTAQVLSDFDAVIEDPKGLSAFRAIQAPTLLLYGERSPATTQRLTALLGRTISGARIESIPDAGHLGPLTHGDVINPIVDDFIRDCRSGRVRGAKPVDTRLAYHSANEARA